MPFDTPIIDSGVGADENPIAGDWAALRNTQAGIKRASNVFASGTAPAGATASYRTPVYTPDCEFYVRVASIPATSEDNYLYARVTGAGGDGSVLNGYALQFGKDGAGLPWIGMYRLNNGSATSLSPFLAPTWSIGDYVGIRCVGSSIEGWYKPIGTGVWVIAGSPEIDSSFATVSGSTALWLNGGSTADTLGGGSLGVARSTGFLSGVGW